MKNVQIPYDLFVALLQYHLMMDDDYADEIRYGLEQKLEAMVRHEWYAKYKTAPTRKNEKHPVSVIWMSVAFHRVSDGKLLLGRDDRSVPRSCEWQIRK